jgi:homoserine dehydrogenase
MKSYNLILVGFGNVGRAFARLALRKQAILANQYGLDIHFTGLATGSNGIVFNPAGLNIELACQLIEQGHTFKDLPDCERLNSVEELVKICPGNVLFENSPVNHAHGEPAISHLRMALQHGMHAITANKGPVVFGFTELSALAKAHGKRFLFESTVMDGAPIFSLFREPLPALDVSGFSGILNSCTNLILERMDAGESFEKAVAYTQMIGIAETDPNTDIDGWDAAIKVAALSTVILGIPLKPQQVDRQGIRSITPVLLAEARQKGLRWKLVCEAQRLEGGKVQARVAPQLVSPDSPLFCISGTSSYVQFKSDCLPGLGIIESDPGPETTAYGLLADLITAVSQEVQS